MDQASLINRGAQEDWLQRYYAVRAGFSILWVCAMLTVAQGSGVLTAVLLVAYPAWDALANWVDGRRSGGLAGNRSQMFNIVASSVAAAGVAFALPDRHGVMAVFGAWAILAGLLQLATALGRWKHSGAQWVMALSGAQSALAGAFFLFLAWAPAPPPLAHLAGYAGFGALYFMVSALWLAAGARIKGLRRRS